MSLSQDNFIKAKALFLQREDLKDGASVLNKVTILINELAKTFNELDGGALSEIQVKLSGYKFYLSDYIADLMNKSKYLDAWIKEEKAIRYDEMINIIKEEDPNIKNKEDIKKKVDNLLLINLSPEINEQIFFEVEWQRYKMKSFAIDDILTSIVQRLAELKRQQEQSRRT
jgi:hypothetical protein